MTDIVFELSSLVTAKCKAGTVIALDPDISLKIAAQIIQPFEWSWLVTEINCREGAGQHRGSLRDKMGVTIAWTVSD